MKFIYLLAVLIFNTALCFSQVDPKLDAKEAEELARDKAFEDAVKNAFEERDRALSKPQVIYYAPVIDPSGRHIGYVKRTLEYRLKGGGIIPFLSDAPEVTWISDAIEVCERDLATGHETTIMKWVLPKPVDAREVGTVFVDLDWREKLYFQINLTKYSVKQFPNSTPGGGSGINLSNGYVSKDGSNSADGITVGVDIESECYRYPASNKIVITCEKARSTCPKF